MIDRSFYLCTFFLTIDSSLSFQADFCAAGVENNGKILDAFYSVKNNQVMNTLDRCCDVANEVFTPKPIRSPKLPTPPPYTSQVKLQ
jgi:hypothetical protein